MRIAYMGGRPREPGSYSLGADASARVADRVRKKMEALGLSGLALSQKAGIAQPHISELLNGKRKFQRHHVQKLAPALGTTEAELVAGLAAGADESQPLQAIPKTDTVPTTTIDEFITKNASRLSPVETSFLQRARTRLSGLPQTERDIWDLLDVIREEFIKPRSS